MYEAGVEPSRLLLRSSIGLLHQPRIIDGDGFGAISGMSVWQEKLKYSEKACPSATLSATCVHPGRRGGKPTTA
jgi:hypothetical protein